MCPRRPPPSHLKVPSQERGRVWGVAPTALVERYAWAGSVRRLAYSWQFSVSEKREKANAEKRRTLRFVEKTSRLFCLCRS
jgi:hypothetical protein